MSEVATPKKVMEVGEGQHRISYAYASSENACKVGRGKSGCFILETKDKMVPKDSYEAAVGEAGTLGTQAHRWSMDHPMNAQFLNR